MHTVDDAKSALLRLNTEYPRPRLEPLQLSPEYDLHDFAKAYPGVGQPGVYLLLDADRNVLRVGKASCGRTLDQRLTDYFAWDRAAGRGIGKEEAYRSIRYIATIALPRDRAFEAPAIEEFLIDALQPPLNHIGRQPAQPCPPTEAPENSVR